MLPPCVLIVDDSRASRAISSALARVVRPDCEIVEAEDGIAALEVIAKSQIDLTILDMNMPGMSGLDIAELMRERQPDARLALLTANGQYSVRTRASLLRVPLFRKPVTQEVIAMILSILPAAGATV